jgi:hypothetical protein
MPCTKQYVPKQSAAGFPGWQNRATQNIQVASICHQTSHPVYIAACRWNETHTYTRHTCEAWHTSHFRV